MNNKYVKASKNIKWPFVLLNMVSMGLLGITFSAYAAFDTHRRVIDFDDYEISSYSGNQDQSGDWGKYNQGRSLELTGNRWKKIPFDYNITPNTVIEFTFQSSHPGEIHGIGFDNDDSLDYNKGFNVHGTQNWGIQDWSEHRDYNSGLKSYGKMNKSRRYSIPVGQFYTGQQAYLFFGNDNDVPNPTATSTSRFTDIVIHEGCDDSLTGTPGITCYDPETIRGDNDTWSVGDTRGGRLYPGDFIDSPSGKYFLRYGYKGRLRILERVSRGRNVTVWKSALGNNAVGGGYAELNAARGLEVVHKNGSRHFRMQKSGSHDNDTDLFHNYVVEVTDNGDLRFINSDTLQEGIANNQGVNWSNIGSSELKALWQQQGWNHVNNWSTTDIDNFSRLFSYMGPNATDGHANHFEAHRYLHRLHHDDEAHYGDTSTTDTRRLIDIWSSGVWIAESVKGFFGQKKWTELDEMTQAMKEFVTLITTLAGQAEDGTLDIEQILTDIVMATAQNKDDQDNLMSLVQSLFHGDSFHGRYLQDASTSYFPGVNDVLYADHLAKWLGKNDKMRFDYALEADFSATQGFGSLHLPGNLAFSNATSFIEALQFRVFATHPRFDSLTGESRFDVRIRLLDLDGAIITAAASSSTGKDIGPLAKFGASVDGGLYGIWDLVFPVTKNLQTNVVTLGNVEWRGGTGAIIEGSIGFKSTMKTLFNGLKSILPNSATQIAMPDALADSGAEATGNWMDGLAEALEFNTGSADITGESASEIQMGGLMQESNVASDTGLLTGAESDAVSLTSSLDTASSGATSTVEAILDEGSIENGVSDFSSAFESEVEQPLEMVLNRTYMKDPMVVVYDSDGEIVHFAPVDSFTAEELAAMDEALANGDSVGEGISRILTGSPEKISANALRNFSSLNIDESLSTTSRRLGISAADLQIGVGAGLGININLSPMTHNERAGVAGAQTLGWFAGGLIAGVVDTIYFEGANMPLAVNGGLVLGGFAADAALWPIYPSYVSGNWGAFWWGAVRPGVWSLPEWIQLPFFGNQSYRARFQYNQDLAGSSLMGDPIDEWVKFKTAKMSSIYEGNTVRNGPNKAIDGNINGSWQNDPINNSVAHTAMNNSGVTWWSGDLGVIREIDRIMVHNRIDCCADRLRGFQVLISNQELSGLTEQEAINHPSVTYHYTIPTRTRGKVAVKPPQDVYGRFVYLVKDSGILNIAEVMAYTNSTETAGDWLITTSNDTAVDLAQAKVNLNVAGLPTERAQVLDFNASGYQGHYHNNYPFPDSLGSGMSLKAEGRVYIPESGVYTFGMNADDGGQILVDNTDVVTFDRLGAAADSLGKTDLTKGYHNIIVYYFDGGGPHNLEVFMAKGDKTAAWNGTDYSLLTSTRGNDSWSVTTINHNASIKDLSTAQALLKDVDNVPYYRDVINMNDDGNHGNVGSSEPFPGIPPGADNFALRALGQVYIREKGVYSFATNSDDGVWLLVDGLTVIKFDGLVPATNNFTNLELTKGIHNVEVIYFHYTAPANLEILFAKGLKVQANMADFSLLKSVTGKKGKQ